MAEKQPDNLRGSHAHKRSKCGLLAIYSRDFCSNKHRYITLNTHDARRSALRSSRKARVREINVRELLRVGYNCNST